MVRRPSVVRRRPSSVVRRPQCSKIFSSKTACPIKAKFYVELPWVGGTKVCSWHLGHMTKMAATPIYGKNPSKIFFSGTGRPISTFVQMMTLGWPWPILRQGQIWYFGLFYRKKWKLLIFQNNCSLWPETNWKNEHVWVLKVKVISWPWPKVIYIQNLKLAFLRNHWANQSQILYVIFQVQGNENFSDVMMLVTWPRWPPYSYMVKTLKKSSSLEPVDRFPWNLVCSINDSCPS